MKYDVVTIGDAFEDVFVQPDLKAKYDRSFASGRGICFEFGEKIALDSIEYEIGGSACNAAVGFARLGYKTGIATVLGDDTPKDKVIERIDIENVGSESVNIDEKSQTGFSVIFNIDGERTIFVYHGVKDYSKLKIKTTLRSKWFFVTPLGEKSQEIEDRVIREVSEHNSYLAWNPGSIQIAKGASHFQHMLRATTVLFLNKEEAIKLLHVPIRPNMEQVLRRLESMGPKFVVITEGKDGARVFDGKNIYHKKADLRIHRVDATGAGDSFAVGFLGKLMELDLNGEISEQNINEALEWGTRNSASVIQYIGSQRGLLSKCQISNS